MVTQSASISRFARCAHVFDTSSAAFDAFAGVVCRGVAGLFLTGGSLGSPVMPEIRPPHGADINSTNILLNFGRSTSTCA